MPQLIDADAQTQLFRDLSAAATRQGSDSNRSDPSLAVVQVSSVPNVIYGTDNADIRSGTSGADMILGFDGSDILLGNGGDDILNGGAGFSDTMFGGEGSDIYYVDSTYDVVADSEVPSSDYDVVYTTVSFAVGDSMVESVIASNIESTNNLNLSGAVGNESLTGNAGNNILYGFSGDDKLFGNAGADTLDGDKGDDWLDGGAGADVMRGGAEDDTYILNNIYDAVFEAIGQGVDTVYVSGSYTLGANVENVLAQDGFIVNSLTGNGLNNLIQGNKGSNTLTGGEGYDTFKFSLNGKTDKTDTITDFYAPRDSIMLKSLYLDDQSTLLPGQFLLGDKAVTAANRVIYDESTGNLYFDRDGTGAGAQELFAHIANRAAIRINDFLIAP